jgi:sigma-B regulation protein RsbU (phosphoserine phosphatase)
MRAIARYAEEWLGRAGIVFAILLASYLTLNWFAPQALARPAIFIAAIAAGLWLLVRVARRVLKAAVWRLRNRLLVTYVFIAVVPIALILSLATLGAYSLVNQLAVYLVTSELDRRIEALEDAARSMVEFSPERMAELAPRIAEVLGRGSSAGLEILGRGNKARFRYPPDSSLVDPPEGWETTRGVLIRGTRPYLWSFSKSASSSLTVTMPLTRELLASLVPGLGVVDFGASNGSSPVRADTDGTAVRTLPPAAFSFDREVLWFATVPSAEWDRPGQLSNQYVIAVRTRLSAVLASVFNRDTDVAQRALTLLLLACVVVFVVVEIVSLMLGFAMTRTITGAVHHLYEGTQKITEGDFAYRIEVSGADQLAELGHSFNRMIANIQRLLAVAKEKERLQSEIEIAREVQQQLFPRQAPQTASWRITAVCQPARMVSGDYYDYAVLPDSRVVLAIGDVAGKGISAALLMASLQSALRSQLQVAGDSGSGLSTAVLVERINRQLYAATSPEKYATLFLGIYDPANGVLTYTNGGHLPPALIRAGSATRLEVNGTIVGAFPAAAYRENRVELEPGDLLVAFTDGATESENSYDEMFGEDRLAELIARHAGRSDEEIVQAVAAGIREWTGSDELQDDLTLLLIRRL